MSIFSKKRNICLVHCHPNRQSFNAALADQYESGALSSGHEVNRFDVYDMHFDPALRTEGNLLAIDLEQDLQRLRAAVEWCDHLVLVFPLWWFGPPALLKGLLDRLLAPGWAFKFNGPFMWDKLLKGKSARVIYTMDSPPLVAEFMVGHPIVEGLKKGTLEFVGFGPVNVMAIGPVKFSNGIIRKCWKMNVEKLGRRAG